jgi:hypothetical protein
LGFRPDRYGRDTRLIAALTLGVNSATTRELVMNADANMQSRPQADISP